MDVIFFDERVKRFVNTFSLPTSARVYRTIRLLYQYGHMLGMPYSKPLGGGFFELRTHGKQAVRLLYVFHNDRAVLLHGYIKKTEEIPHKEFEIAKRKFSNIDGI